VAGNLQHQVMLKAALVVVMIGIVAGVLLQTGTDEHSMIKRNIYLYTMYHTHVYAAGQEAFVNSTILAMHTHPNNTDLQGAACWSLGRIAAKKYNSHAKTGRVKISAAGGLERIIEAMGNHSNSLDVQHYGAFALFHLADNDENQLMISVLGGVEQLMSAMQNYSTHRQIQEFSCGALGNIAVNPINQVKIATLGGIELILHAMQMHKSDVHVQRQGCFALMTIADNVAGNQVSLYVF